MILCPQKIIFALTAFLASGMVVPFAQAESVRIAVMLSNDSAPYRETLTGFQEHISKQNLQSEYYIYNLNADTKAAEKAVQEIKKNRVSLILTIGTIATESAINSIKDVPIVAGLVLKADKLNDTKNATGVILEFPLETQFKMMKRFIPEIKTVGVVYNPGENKDLIKTASKVAQDMGLRLDAQEVNTPQQLPYALERLVNSADVLWGVADKLVLTSETAKHILLFSYQNRIPFIGLSTPWVQAGALYSLDRDYTDIGIQCGELAIKILQGSRAGAIPAVLPRKIVYSLNLKAARHMKVHMSDTIIKGAYQVY